MYESIKLYFDNGGGALLCDLSCEMMIGAASLTTRHKSTKMEVWMNWQKKMNLHSLYFQMCINKLSGDDVIKIDDLGHL